jgi:hypothetical protein
MKLEKYLIGESATLNARDKSRIKTLLASPKTVNFVLDSFKDKFTEDERKFTGRKTGEALNLEYLGDFDDITNYLISLCDDSGKAFDTDTDKNGKQHFDIWLE